MIRVERRTIDWTEVKARVCAAESAINTSSAVDDTRMQEIFRIRAERLAAGATRNEATAATTTVLVFRLGDDRYGIELSHVAEVFAGVKITPVPGGPEALAGVANLRGEVRPVLDLRRLLALPDQGRNRTSYILLLRRGTRRTGLQVDDVDTVCAVDMRELRRDRQESVGERAGLIEGVTQDNLIVLRIDALFDRQSPAPHSAETAANGGRQAPKQSTHPQESVCGTLQRRQEP